MLLAGTTDGRDFGIGDEEERICMMRETMKVNQPQDMHTDNDTPYQSNIPRSKGNRCSFIFWASKSKAEIYISTGALTTPPSSSKTPPSVLY